MLIATTLTLLTLVASGAAQTTGDEDYFNNDLAKDCRPSERSLDLLFVLDGSGSVKGTTFQTQKRMVKQIVDLVDVAQDKTVVSLMQYSGWSRTEVDFQDHLNRTSFYEILSGLRHLSGTTRTGRALTKALTMFKDNARMRDSHVAKVVVVVSDGHSIDDPVPAAERLRREGIQVLVVGIGQYVNMHELRLMAGDSNLAFTNETLGDFVTQFKQIAVGEHCDYKKKPRGAEIICGEDDVMVHIETSRPFSGHLYVPGHYGDERCIARSTSANRKLVSLRIPLMGCGVQKQFLFEPRGLLFETTVNMQLHPEYSTVFDRAFAIRCFYPDMRFDKAEHNKNKPEIATQRDGAFDKSSDTLVSRLSVPDMQMPCRYQITRGASDDKTRQRSRTSSSSTADGCVLEDTRVGDTVVHRWECDREVLGADYRMRVHSCYFTDATDARRRKLVVDSNGCSTDDFIIADPIHMEDLYVMAPGKALKYADNSNVQFQCSLSFCDKNSTECPQRPVCEREEQQPQKRKRRQVSFQSMSQHMIDRLFQHRKNLMNDPRQSAIRSRIYTKAASISSSQGSTTDQPAATDARGRPLFRTLRPISHATASPRIAVLANTQPAFSRPASRQPPTSRRTISAKNSPTSSAASSSMVTDSGGNRIIINTLATIKPTRRTTVKPSSSSSGDSTSANIATPSRRQSSHRNHLPNRPQMPRLSPPHSMKPSSSTKSKKITAEPRGSTKTSLPTTVDDTEGTSRTIQQSSTRITTSTTEELTTERTTTTTSGVEDVTKKDNAPKTSFALDNDAQETQRPSSLTLTVTRPKAEEPKETPKMADVSDMRGLAREIVEGLAFMQVELRSQIITVKDLQDVRSHGKSPIDWCPAKDA